MKLRVTGIHISGNWTLFWISDEEKVMARASQVVYMDKGKLSYNGNFEGYKFIWEKDS